MNTHETYVSLETAQLLKKAGFDWECRYGFDEKRTICRGVFNTINWNDGKTLCCSRPELHIAQKWLREVKNMNIEVSYDKERNWNFACVFNMDEDITYDNYFYEKYFDTYESALEAGIKKCLTLILEKE